MSLVTSWLSLGDTSDICLRMVARNTKARSIFLYRTTWKFVVQESVTLPIDLF